MQECSCYWVTSQIREREWQILDFSHHLFFSLFLYMENVFEYLFHFQENSYFVICWEYDSKYIINIHRLQQIRICVCLFMWLSSILHHAKKNWWSKIWESVKYIDCYATEITSIIPFFTAKKNCGNLKVSSSNLFWPIWTASLIHEHIFLYVSKI